MTRAQKFFPRSKSKSEFPQIYAYSDTRFIGCLKIGYTSKEDVTQRIKAQYPTKTPIDSWKLEYFTEAFKADGSNFIDKTFHKYLEHNGIKCIGGEWYKISTESLKKHMISFKRNELPDLSRDWDFKMRPEQEQAVEVTYKHFNKFIDSKHKPHFLWNAKMRFGKTFAAYQLAIKMNWRKVLVMTWIPAVQAAWEEDIKRHIDFKEWQFISGDEIKKKNFDISKPMVCFGSCQDLTGINKHGGIKSKNEWIHNTEWDCIIFDEYHYGAHREKTKSTVKMNSDVDYDNNFLDKFEINQLEKRIPIDTSNFLYLSGTPFRAISEGEFTEDEIYNWTYSDEQRAKSSWKDNTPNPYLSLPRMVLITYKVPEEISQIATKSNINEFDLHEFFKTNNETDEKAKFIHEDNVQAWLDFIRGSHKSEDYQNLSNKKKFLPFGYTRLLENLNHTFWLLPYVSSCYAMKNLFEKRNNVFFHDYNVIVAAGNKAGIGVKALKPVLNAMGKNPLKSKTITLSCGKLQAGVTVPPWTGVFVLRNNSSPETYFQSSFRVQSPWKITNESDLSDIILKEECYVFDFAPNRALNLLAQYASELQIGENISLEKKIHEFTNFLPVLAYENGNLIPLNPTDILDYAMNATPSSLVAQGWTEDSIINTEDAVLERLLGEPDLLDELMKIDGFRSLSQDISIIVTQSDEINKLQKEKSEQSLSVKEKKELTTEEKENISRRKKLKDKLKKFSSRIPHFMYLTDKREETLEDVITMIEPKLFTKVTSISQEIFKKLKDIGVFPADKMNRKVLQFKLHEDASLEYTGISKQTKRVALWDTTLTREEFENQINSNS
jgi:hypothetical protein